MSEANALTNELLIAIPKHFPGARCWRQNTGSGVGMSVIKQAIEALRRKSIAEAIGLLSRRPISFGIEGGADISGILPIKVGSATLGLRLEVEVKTGLDKMRDSQIAFRVMILAGGGVYVVARSVEQCLEELGRWG